MKTLSILVLAPLVVPARADNGALARATLVATLAIDGDASDWPHDAERLALDEDTTLRLAFSLSERALFACVETRDERHVDTPGSWEERDTCLVYVDRRHSPRGSGPACWVVGDAGLELLDPRGTWDPEAAAVTRDEASAAVRRVGEMTTYEFRVALDEVHVGGTLGFDVVLVDADGEGEPEWIPWGPGLGKSRAAGRLGDVLLAAPGTTLATLSGEVRWTPGQETEWALPRVRVTSLDDPRCWTQVDVVDGAYAAVLPVGRYEATSAFPVLGDFYQEPSRVLRRGLRVRADLAATGTVAPPLVLEAVAPPDLMQATGLLFDYDESRAPDVDRFLEQALDHLGVPGASVALVKDGRVVYHRALGVKNAYTGEPVDERTLFEACSITKIVFAFAVNRLAERGVLDLDAPLWDVLPLAELEHDERARRMTARHVLTHTSGLPNWRSGGGLELAFEPGTAFGYSGEAFEYLGRVVEKLTGRDLERVLREEVVEPFGFTAYFHDCDELVALASHGHHSLRTNAALAPERLSVAHSLHTEARSFASFLIGLLERRGLSEAGYAEMLRMQSEREPGDTSEAVPWRRGFGLGFAVMETPFGPAFGHAGSNGDFHCLFEAYPDQNAGLVVFANNEKAWTLTELLRKFLVVGAPAH